MKTNTLLKIINPMLALMFVSQIITGLMHGMIPHKIYEVIHGGGAGALIFLVIIHVFLNWNWVKANFLADRRKS